MHKYVLIIFIGSVFASCRNSEPEIFGIYKHHDTGDLIEIDCDYRISLPTNCCNSLPAEHEDIVTLSTTGINESEVTMSVMVDNVQWSFGIWNKDHGTIEIDGDIYNCSEVKICNE